jgi:hypothetical protein
VTDAEEILDRSTRCVLAFSGKRGAVLAPMAFWADGSSLWMSTPAASVKAAAMRRRPNCSVYVAPIGGIGPGLVLAGRVRIYGLHDPLGLAVHGPVVSTAMTALATRNAGTILGYVQDARQVPQRFRPRNRVAVRFTIDEARPVAVPEPGPGVAPALPTVVSPAVRRALSGRRHVVVGTGAPSGTVAITPAVWSSGYALEGPVRDPLPEQGTAAVYLGADPQGRPTRVAGLLLSGELSGGRLQPNRVTWWEGFELTTATIEATASSIIIPE